MMEYECDPAKDEANREKHGVPLAFGLRIFDDPGHRSARTHRVEDGEDRAKLIGMVDGKLFTMIFVWRGAAVRIISVRRANRGEERAYSDPG